MKLTKAAILALRGIQFESKEALAKALGVSMKTLYRYLTDNDDNLTKATALDFIRKETGLADSEILENQTEDTIKGA
jgi:hypothetical protein